MKRFFLLNAICVLALLLGTGCDEKKPKPPKRAKIVKPEKPARPSRPVREVLPGSIAYLDRRNGFRDVTLGDSVTNFSNLVLVSEDSARQLKVYTRTDDDLTFGTVPLQNIRYTFYGDRLCEVELRWKIEYPDAPFRTPPLSSISSYCTKLYGSPTIKRSSRKEQTSQHVWRGRKAELILTEIQLRGVPDVINGTWDIPPTTAGQIAVVDIPLRQAAGAIAASNATRNPHGP